MVAPPVGDAPHLNDVIADYNYARWLKTLRGLTPYEFICKTWAE
jgi:hypothetical protein